MAAIKDLKIVEFCKILSSLKHLPRTGWIRHGILNPESVSGHMYRMALLAFLIDLPSVDRNKIIQMSLVHDLAESLVGDITPHCGVSIETKLIRERDAMKQIGALIPKNVGDQFCMLWEEYEAQTSEEAKIVKDLDKFDMIMQAFEYEQQTKKVGSLQDFFDSTPINRFNSDVIQSWAATLLEKRNMNLDA